MVQILHYIVISLPHLVARIRRSTGFLQRLKRKAQLESFRWNLALKLSNEKVEGKSINIVHLCSAPDADDLMHIGAGMSWLQCRSTQDSIEF